jgi:hypothetical protein
VLFAQEQEPGAPPARALRDERDHRAVDRGVIAPDGERSCDRPTRGDRNAPMVSGHPTVGHRVGHPRLEAGLGPLSPGAARQQTARGAFGSERPEGIVALCLVVCESKDRIAIGVPAIARGSGGGSASGGARRAASGSRQSMLRYPTMRRHASLVLGALDGQGFGVGLKPRAIHAR